MLSNSAFGCSVFLVANLSVLYTAHLSIRRFLSKAPASVRLVAFGLVYYSFIILIFQALSPFHAISRTWVTITSLLLALTSHLLWGQHRNLLADVEPIRLWIRDGLASRWAALLIICGFVVLLSFSRALLMPPLAWDCLTYHLTFAALWVKEGSLQLFTAPDQIINAAHFPINGEIFASWLILPFHNDVLVNIMNFPITLLGGISCYAIARELGLTRKEASFAPALICFAPMIYIQITAAYVDNAVFAFCSASVLFTLRYLRRGYLIDCLLDLVAGGILLGIKYSAIPVVGLITIATTIKTLCLVRNPGFLKKSGLIVGGLLILCILGGRQYIHNTIEAGNPLYPLPVIISGSEIFEGWGKLEQFKEWVSRADKKRWDKFSGWEREYRKFCYLSMTAGPKFLLFLIMAVISLFTRPHNVSKRCWFFLSTMWVIPIVIFYADTSAHSARSAYWSEGSTRYLSPFIALFTIQALVFIKRFGRYFKGIDFFLVALVAWDLLYVNKTHLWEVEVLYPFVLLMIPLLIVLYKVVGGKSHPFALKKEALASPAGVSRMRSSTIKRGAVFAMGFFVLVAGLYFLQSYRDNTRYIYYRSHIDLQRIPRDYVNAWEFLDRPDEKKTVAMAMDWTPPGDRWFFYPLLGKRLQNDVAYISAQHRGEVPTRINRGLLRGNDFSIWLYNIKEKNVDYMLIQGPPWPIELGWMLNHQDAFQRVFADENCKIFKYTGK